jgi:hypothetical protein
LVLTVAVAECALPSFAQAQQSSPAQQKVELPAVPARGKKLFLKDGSFHLVRCYERVGDRVRFYSVERSAWEELPTSLIDWEATQKAEAEAASLEAKIAEAKAKAREAQIIEEVDVDASIEVAPGVFLPDGNGLFVVEGNAIRVLAPVGAEVKLDKGRVLTQILVPIPLIPSRHRVQIPGPRAAFRLTTAQPEFYIRTEDAREPEMELIRAKVKGNSREIERISTIITGDKYEDRKVVSVQRWQVAKGVYRLTLSQSLEPGEYVLAEVFPDKGLDLGVWDFGVDGPAPTKPAKKE